MKNFIFHSPTEILFGKGQIENLAKKIKGRRVLLVCGKTSIKKIGLYDKLIKIFDDNNIFYKILTDIDPNPRIESARKGIKICRNNKLDFVLAAGGGSTIDCSKAIALGVFYKGDPWELTFLFEGKREYPIEKALPLGCILTLSATGTEMNENAVLTDNKNGLKAALYHPLVKPSFSILDPKYTISVSKYQTGCGTTDIMSHIYEQYFDKTKCTYIQDKLAEALLKVCVKFGKTAIEIPEHYEARSSLMWTSTLALNGLLSSGKEGDWATHQIEHGLSAVNDMAHGAGLAILHPNWMKYVFSKDGCYDKFYSLGKNVWGLSGDKNQVAENSIKKTREFFSQLGMPSCLSEVGITKDQLMLICEKTMLGRETIGTYTKLNKQDVFNILNMSF